MRPHQLLAYHSLMDKRHHCLHIAPTGSGKTLPVLFAAARIPPRKIILFLLPFRVLYDQVINACKAFRVPAEMWHNGAINSSTKVVIASVEICTGFQFKQWLLGVAESQDLYAICIDEASCLIDDRDYREAFKKLPDTLLSVQGVPLHLMTATCPPGYEDFIWNAIGLKKTAYIEVIRVPTVKENICWNFMRYSSQGPGKSQASWKTKIDEIYKHKKTFEQNEKIIVFCHEVVDVEQIAKYFDVLANNPEGTTPHLHGRMNEKERNASLSRWSNNTSLPILVANKAAYYGLDNANVKRTYFVTIPDSLTELVQAAGRGGRNGRNTTAYIFWNATDNFPRTKYEPTFSGKRELHNALIRGECFLALLKSFFDGITKNVKTCREPYLCSRCTVKYEEWVDVPPINYHQASLPTPLPRTGNFDADYHRAREEEKLSRAPMDKSIAILQWLADGLEPDDIRRKSRCIICSISSPDTRHDTTCPTLSLLLFRQTSLGLDYVTWRKKYMPSELKKSRFHKPCLLPWFTNSEIFHPGRQCLSIQIPWVICYIWLNSGLFREFQESNSLQEEVTDKTVFLEWCEKSWTKDPECSNAMAIVIPWFVEKQKILCT
jgi:hypothetical protein